MTTLELFVENIKGCGCMNRIKTSLLELEGIQLVEITQESGRVFISGIDLQKEQIEMKLHGLGFPVAGSNTVISIAESFRSCVLGGQE